MLDPNGLASVVWPIGASPRHNRQSCSLKSLDGGTECIDHAIPDKPVSNHDDHLSTWGQAPGLGADPSVGVFTPTLERILATFGPKRATRSNLST
jgi:hypothetical protein